jgi:mitogen-activated protein kinase kinase
VSLVRYQNEHYAMKQVPNVRPAEREIEELQCLSNLLHPNIVRYRSHWVKDNQLTILMEWVDGRSLAAHYGDSQKVPERVLGRLAWLCLQVLKYLRQKHVLHRDLKPSNIMLSKTGDVKVCDFGIGAFLPGSLGLRETNVGTMKYMSPERLEAKPHSFPADIWSLGMCLYEGALGRYPVDDSAINVHVLCEKLKESLTFVLPGYSADFVDFLRQCLAIVPAERLKIETADECWAAKFKEDGQIDLQKWIDGHTRL